jgi:hypothetical protein
MPCSIDASVGGAAANSYCEIATADAHFAGQLHTDVWDAADEDTKCKALRMATRLLDRQFEWAGDITSDGQALLWPRIGVTGRTGLEIASDALPPELVEATAEYAQQLISEDRSADSDVETAGLKRLVAGPVELEFENVQAKAVPDAVFFLVSHLGDVKTRGAGSVPLHRV